MQHGRRSPPELEETLPEGAFGAGPSPTWHHHLRATSWREPSPTRRHSWLILDRFVHRSRRLEGVDKRNAMASATSYDCVGQPVRASLRVVGSPAVSRLHLHLPNRERIEDLVEPAVIAAHHNSILFKVIVPFKDSEWTDPPRWGAVCFCHVPYQRRAIH